MLVRRQSRQQGREQVGPGEPMRNGASQLGIKKDRHSIGRDAPSLMVGGAERGVAAQLHDMVEVRSQDAAWALAVRHGIVGQLRDQGGLGQVGKLDVKGMAHRQTPSTINLRSLTMTQATRSGTPSFSFPKRA